MVVTRDNEKGRVERSIRYIRDNFLAARVFYGVADLNVQVKAWTDGLTFDRPWPQGVQLTVRQAFEAESPSLIALLMDAYPVDARVEVTVSAQLLAMCSAWERRQARPAQTRHLARRTESTFLGEGCLSC